MGGVVGASFRQAEHLFVLIVLIVCLGLAYVATVSSGINGLSKHTGSLLLI